MKYQCEYKYEYEYTYTHEYKYEYTRKYEYDYKYNRECNYKYWPSQAPDAGTALGHEAPADVWEGPPAPTLERHVDSNTLIGICKNRCGGQPSFASLHSGIDTLRGRSCPNCLLIAVRM